MLREVAAQGSIAGAARALYMTPSAVSQQMAVLEREAGTELLERSGRGVRLTEAGLRLVKHTEVVLAELERAEADLAAASVGLVGSVSVSAFPTGARAVLIPALVVLQERHPNLRLSMIDLEPEESLPALKAGELDVVMTYEWDILPTIEDPGIDREHLITEPVLLAMPANHPLADGRPVNLAHLSTEQWIVGKDSSSMLDLVVAAAGRAGFEPRTNFHSMDFEVILAAVAAGLGVSLVPSITLPESESNVAFVPVAGMSLHRRIWAAVRAGSSGHPGIAAVLEALREVSAEVAAGHGLMEGPAAES